jgi:hypothetical protein
MTIQHKDIAHLIANIYDVRLIPHIRKTGPIQNLVLPMKHFSHLVAQKFSMEVLKAVLNNGSVVDAPEDIRAMVSIHNVPASLEMPKPVAATVDVPEVAEEVAPVADPIVAEAVAPVVEPEKVADAVEPEPEAVEPVEYTNLMDTISHVDGEMSVAPLTEEQYNKFNKAELTEFLQAVAPALGEEAQAAIAAITKKTTQDQLVAMVVANLIAE